jgi:hypothetical protein
MAGDDEDIFASATAPEPTPSDDAEPTGNIVEDRSPVDRAVSDAISDLGRTGGRFQVTTPAPAPRPAQAKEADLPEDRSLAGLMQAMLSEREKRQSAERERDQVRQFIEERKREEEAKKTPLSQQLFEDPDRTMTDFGSGLRQEFQDEIRQIRLTTDFEFASLRHPETWNDAYKTWYEHVSTGQDPHTYFATINAASPSEMIVKWYNEKRMREEVGDDVAAFKQRVIDEYLAGQSVAPPPRDESGRFAPRPQAPRLPTSISRMGASGNGIANPDEDGSEAAIFAAGRPESRARR